MAGRRITKPFAASSTPPADGEEGAASREAFWATSDVGSLHVRIKPETRGLITADDLAAINGESLLVNTSRAGLIEAGALKTAPRST